MFFNKQNFNRIKAVLAILAILLSIPIIVGAAEQITLLDEVVVTATRLEERRFDVPTSVELIPLEDLNRSNPATAAQPLAEIPGVSLSSAGYWSSIPIIRGLGGNRVLVLIDGDRENNLWAGRSPITPFIDIGNVERIEVVKGPASVLYGTDALGGVVNVISKQPNFSKTDKWSLLNHAESRYSSVDDGWSGLYSIAGGGYGLDFSLTVTARDADSYKDGDGHEVENSQFKGKSFAFKGRYFLDEAQNHDLSINVNSHNISDMGVPTKQGARYSHFSKFDTDTYKLAYHGHDLGWLRDLHVRGWYVDQERIYEGNIPSTTSPVYKLKGNDIETSALGVSLQGEVDINSRNRLVFGGEFVNEESDGDEYITVKRNGNDSTAKELTFKPIPDSSRDHFSFFAQDRIYFGERTTVLTGLRYDYFVANAEDVLFITDSYNGNGALTGSQTAINYFGKKSDDAVTFNLGLVYSLTENLNLTCNLSSGFRAPDIFERYSTRSGSYMMIGNPELNPEYSYNGDLGVKFNYSRLRGAVSGFYSQVTDYIDLVNNGNTFAGMESREFVNVTEAELYGADGSLEFDLLEKLSVYGNLAYVVGRDRNSHDRLNTIPPLNGMLGARWHDQLSNGLSYWFDFDGNCYAAQKHPAPGENETPGYTIFNLHGGIKFDYGSFKDITLSVNIENLFDKTYRNHLNTMDFYNDPGFNVITAVKVSF